MISNVKMKFFLAIATALALSPPAKQSPSKLPCKLGDSPKNNAKVLQTLRKSLKGLNPKSAEYKKKQQIIKTCSGLKYVTISVPCKIDDTPSQHFATIQRLKANLKKSKPNSMKFQRAQYKLRECQKPEYAPLELPCQTNDTPEEHAFIIQQLQSKLSTLEPNSLIYSKVSSVLERCQSLKFGPPCKSTDSPAEKALGLAKLNQELSGLKPGTREYEDVSFKIRICTGPVINT